MAPALLRDSQREGLRHATRMTESLMMAGHTGDDGGGGDLFDPRL